MRSDFVGFSDVLNDSIYQFVSSSIYDAITGGAETDTSNIDYTDNDKMDRHESSLKYIGDDYGMKINQGESFVDHRDIEQRFSDMFTQDAYYDLPRGLY